MSVIRKNLGAFAASTFLVVSTGALAQSQSPSPMATPSTAAQAAQEHSGFLKSVQGTVHLVGPSGKKRVAKAGDALARIDCIETGPDSGASMVLRDGTMIVVGPSSRLDLNQFDFDATTYEGSLVVSLLKGSLRMVTGLLGKKPDGIRVDTHTATIGIRGTDFIVTADDKT